MRRLATALACTSALLLGACGTSEGTPPGGTDRELTEEELQDPTDDNAQVDAGGEDDEQQPFQCVDLSPAPDGAYAVGDAGTVRLEDQEDGLVLGSVTPAEGWEHEVAEEDADQIEVRFTQVDGGDEVSLLVTRGNDNRAEQPEVLVEVCTQVE